MHISLEEEEEEEESTETIMSMQKAQPESIVSLPEESKGAQWHWAAEMEGEG